MSLHIKVPLLICIQSYNSFLLDPFTPFVGRTVDIENNPNDEGYFDLNISDDHEYEEDSC